MTGRESTDIVSNMELIVREGRSRQPLSAEMRFALRVVIDWLAARVPYKEPLPRGYSVHFTVKPDGTGEMRRFHRLLKAAAPGVGGAGVWIDTAALADVDVRDVAVFADDLATGLLGEIIAFLQGQSPAN